MTSALLVSGGGAGSSFLAHGGRPVWPVQTARDRRSLEAIAGIFGGHLTEVDAVATGLDDAGPHEELVVGIGAEIAAETRLYAHLTQRRALVVESASDIWARHEPAVVLTLHRHLSSHLLDALSEPRADSACGVLTALTAEDLRHQVLVKAAAAQLNGDAPVPRVDLDFSGEAPTERASGNHLVVTPREAPEAIRTALGSGAGVLSFRGHSDGVDADLGPTLTLCPMDRQPLHFDPLRPPRCSVTKQCYRKNKPVSDVLSGAEVVAPEGFSARLLLWTTCRAVMVANHAVDPAWGLALRFFGSATLGGVIAPWNVVVSKTDVEPLVTDLLAGTPAGVALARFHRRAEIRRAAHRACLFGDPRTRSVPHVSPVLRPSPRSGSSRPKAPSDRSGASEIALARNVVGAHAASESPPRHDLRKTLYAIRRFEHSVRCSTTAEDALAGDAASCRRLVLDYLLDTPDFTERWMSNAAVHRETEGASCSVCGAPAIVLHCSSRISGVRPRTIVRCHRCGIVGDTPEGARLGISIREAGELRLDGDLASNAWTAAIALEAPGPPRRDAWPAADDGRPASHLLTTFPGAEADPVVRFCLVDGFRAVILRARRGAGARRES
jgi:hypothetical protein